MVNEFQFDYHFSIGESKPKPVAEREGEEQTGHADSFLVQFSHSPPEVEAAGDTKDHVPVDGGVFLVQFGEKSTVISFKRFNSPSGLSQRYLDLIYKEVSELKKSKKQYVCEINKPNLNSLKVRIYGHAKSGQLRLSYQTSQKEGDYANCFLMNHYDRHIGHNFFYQTILARTPDERNSELFLTEAKLKVDRIQIDFEQGGNYDKRVYERITSRINNLDRVKKLPKKVLGGLLKIQNIMTQKSEHLQEYAMDFHKGLQSMQEHFLTTIGKTKSKRVSDVGLLRNLMENLAELEAKQGRIYSKFAKLHQLVAKASGNDQLESEIASLNSVVAQLSTNLENRGLTRIVEECKTLVRIFKEIGTHREGIENLLKIQQLGFGVSEPASWLGYLLIGGLVIVSRLF